MSWARRVLIAGVSVTVIGCAGVPASPAPKIASGARAVTPLPAASVKKSPLEIAADCLGRSQYTEAEARYRTVLDDPRATPPAVGQARLGLANVLLITGRYAEAAGLARSAIDGAAELGPALVVVEAEALRRQGKLDPARAELERVLSTSNDWRVRLSLGEILIEQGHRFDAKQILSEIIDAYNDGAIAANDPRKVGIVGRAADLLGSAHDANEAYDAAEQAGHVDEELLLWRATMFLDKYDPGHAEEALQRVLARAPNQPEALVELARVKLAQTLDFDAAEGLARQARAVNPNQSGATFILATVALRDQEIDTAEREIQRGLSVDARDLELLSLEGALRFLEDDAVRFHEVERSVLTDNAEYSRFYSIVGETADWEHRYDSIVELMHDALRIDDDDVQALAGLGLNLIRTGDDVGGLAALKRAFARDPFNVRVFNTLNLYDRVLPASYTSDVHAPFRFRYSNDEAPVLKRYVPVLAREAWGTLVRYYGFTPQTPIGIELYAKRQHFAVRTSGLPNIGIEGVCFGKTLALMTPAEEPLNLGMTLWHELSHVFHIQLSKSHVPRWFTEGLAEYETSVRRPEWRRERDPDLYRALRAGKLPAIEHMNRAFSHAEDVNDLTTAYVASTRIVAWLAEHYGRPTLRKMLALWGEGKPTSEVLRLATGSISEQLDAQFREYLRAKLQRYTNQLVPLPAGGDLARLRASVLANPGDSTLELRLAAVLLGNNDLEGAEPLIDAVLHADSGNPDARVLRARLAAAKGDAAAAESLLKGLVADGHDGYGVQLELAGIYQAAKRRDAMKQALSAAYANDPTQAEAIYGLWQLARRQGDGDAELEWLRKLAPLEPHAAEVYQRLLELLIAHRDFDEAVQIGQSALFVDIEGVRTHLLYAKALEATGQLQQAGFELESATLCPADPPTVASACVAYAKFLLSQGKRVRAGAELSRALALDPDNAEAKMIKP